ncbi:MAG TPA: hypothetical protein VII41_03610 [Steroidobacteraceae bacterium]
MAAAGYGIGLELPRLCARGQCALVIAAADSSVLDAAQQHASSSKPADMLIATLARNAVGRDVH